MVVSSCRLMVGKKRGFVNSLGLNNIYKCFVCDGRCLSFSHFSKSFEPDSFNFLNVRKCNSVINLLRFSI